jgi:hypothetical protein
VAHVVIPPAPARLPKPVVRVPPLPSLLAPPQPLQPALIAILPPPTPAFARPVPPGGATVRVFDEEREEEEAPEHSQAFARYELSAHAGVNGQGGGMLVAPYMLVAAILLAAAGASIGLGRRRPAARPWRTRRRAVVFAKAGSRYPYRSRWR